MLIYYVACIILTAVGLTYSSARRIGGDALSVPRSGVHQGGVDDSSNRESLGCEQEPQVPDERRMRIPFQPVVLGFQDLSYEVKASTSNDRIMLLKSVNGIFHPGRMTALMGVSGAGKTTLLDVIALRKRSGTISGSIFLNGWPQDEVSFRRCSGYVEQFDEQSPELTVLEAVLFSARLRLDPEVVKTDEEKVVFCRTVLRDVELDSLAHTLVGTEEGGGLSYEQKKRLSIAVELVAAPSLLFLDEPTSGLGARSALLICRLLRRISNQNRTVVATIHQPSSAVFELFDDLLLLRKGGSVTYHGPLGMDSKTLIDYFESNGAKKIELGDNPANWILRVLQDDRLGELDQVYSRSREFKKVETELSELCRDLNPAERISFGNKFATTYVYRQLEINKRLRTIVSACNADSCNLMSTCPLIFDTLNTMLRSC
jgi:ABC-type multidrug transport system ATPase subunit